MHKLLAALIEALPEPSCLLPLYCTMPCLLKSMIVAKLINLL